MTEVLRVSLEENLAMIRETVAFLREAGREVIYDAEHFFDGWKANPEYARQTIRAAVEGGAIDRRDVRHQRRQHARGSRRRSPRKRPRAVDVPLGIHTHNDCDLAVANSLAAVDAGASTCRARSTASASAAATPTSSPSSPTSRSRSRATKCSAAGGVEHLTELSRYVYEIANMHFRTNQPFVGPSAFAHKGGMHVHAVNRAAQQLRAHRARSGRQRAPRAGERALRPVEHHRPDRPSTTCSTTRR